MGSLSLGRLEIASVLCELSLVSISVRLPAVLAYTYPKFSKGFENAGIHDLRFSLPLGWTGAGVFDPRSADAILDALAAEAPASRWLPMLWMDGPETKWWEAEHPRECAVMRGRETDEIVSFAEGVPTRGLVKSEATASTVALFDYHHQRSPCLHSFASAVWLDQAKQALQQALRHFQNRYPTRFLGFYLCAGLSHEWLGWGHYSDEVLFDYSQPMQAYFQHWLQRRDGDLSALNARWNSPFASWSEVTPPLPSCRPSREAGCSRFDFLAAVDFDCAMADAQADCLIALCQAAKEVLSPKALTGAFYGYWWNHSHASAPARNGHLALQRVLESPAVDFLASPLDYANRGSEGCSTSQSLPDAAVLHGKGFINSADLRLLPDSHPEWQPFVGAPRSISEGVEWMKKDFGHSMARGVSHSWVDLFGGAFTHPSYQRTLADLQRLSQNECARFLPTSTQALLVMDDTSLAMSNPGHAAWTVLLQANRQWHLSRSGFPWFETTLADFLSHDWPQTRLVYFLPLIALTASKIRQIHTKLAAIQATAIWHGIGQSSPEEAELLTGFSLRWRTSSPVDWECIASESHIAFGPSHIRDEARLRMRSFPDAESLKNLPTFEFEESDSTQVLARWSCDDSPAIAHRSFGGFHSVLNTGLLLQESLLAKIAREAAVHCYTLPGPVVQANPRFASVWTRSAQALFTCPPGLKARPLWPLDGDATPQTHWLLPSARTSLLALNESPV